MREFLNRQLTVIIAGLAVLVVLSLAVNVYLLVRAQETDDRIDEVAGGAAVLAAQTSGFFEQLTALAPLLDDALDTADVELEALRTSTIAFEVEVDQVIPIEASFPFTRTLTIPIETSIPINETFETRVTVEGPLGIDVPLDVVIPVEIDVPLSLSVPIDIDETIDVDTEFPLRLAVPVEVDIAGTDFAGLAERLQQGIASIREAVGGL
jgi:hypothetical protein